MLKRLPWKFLIIISLGTYVALSGYLYFSQNSQVFKPPKTLTQTPKEWGMDFSTSVVNSQGAWLSGWWIPGASDRPVIVFFHGNATAIDDLQPHVALFRRLALSVFLFDYQGYGESQGTPSELATYADAEAVWLHVTQDLHISPTRLVYYGHSLGGCVASWLALRHPPKGLILEGTFTSIPDAATDIYPYLPVRLLSNIKYNNIDNIPKIKAPILIMHSSEDAVILYKHSEKLFAVANEPKMFFKLHGTHNKAFSHSGEPGVQVLKRFLALP